MGRIEELERHVGKLAEDLALVLTILENHSHALEILINRPVGTHDHGTHSHKVVIGDSYDTNLA
jgi:hypothetical protein